MLLIWIPVSVLAMYFVLNIVYGKLWKNGLHAELRFEERDVEEGDEATLVETVTNDKFLPLPVVKLSFKMDRSLEIDDDRNATVSDRTNVSEFFGMSGYEEVTRRQPVRARKRGYYLISEAAIALPDFFTEGVRYLSTSQAASLLVCPRMLEDDVTLDISRQIVGEIVSRNRLYQDVFSFRGIREYTRGDPLSAINWKASARTGEYMVNIRDYTCGQHIRFLLDVEPPSIRYSEELLEQGIRLAYTLAGRCIQAQMDRFLMKLSIGLPDEENEFRIMARSLARRDRIQEQENGDGRSAGQEFRRSSWETDIFPVADAETIKQARQEAGKVQVSQDLMRYISALVKSTRERPDIEAGVSPRGTLALLHASQSLAFLEGRSYVVPEDITRLAVSVCAHRLVLARHIGRTAGQKAVMEDILRTVAVPTEQFGRKSDTVVK